MPLIAYREKRGKVPFSVDIISEIDEQIKKYCEWAGVTDTAYFIEEAAKHIFAKDELWNKYLQEITKKK